MKRFFRIWWPAILCFGVAALVLGQAPHWQTDGTTVSTLIGASTAKSIDADGDGTKQISVSGSEILFDPDDDGTSELRLTSSKLEVVGDLSLVGSTNRALNIGDGILTINTNNPNQAFLNSTGFWFLRVGDVDKINLSAGAVVVNEAGVDVNFRVESDTKPNAFFLEGSSGNVGIEGVPAVRFHVSEAVSGEIARFEKSTSGTPANWTSFYDTGGRTAHWGMASSSNDDLHFMNDTATGSLVLGTVSAAALTIESNKNATFVGFTKLGSDAPVIKMKKLTGTTGSSENDTTSIAHGLTLAKILGFSTLVTADNGNLIPDAMSDVAGFEFYTWIDSTNVRISLHPTNSEQLLSNAITVLLTYEE